MYEFKDIVNRIKNNLKNPASTIEGTFTMDNVQAVGQELAQLHSTEIAPIIDAVFWDTAAGSNLDRRAKDIQLERHEAQAAVGRLEFTGRNNTFVPTGTVARFETLLYETTEPVRIGTTGKALAAAKCQTAGTVGNVPAGVVKTMVSRIDGVTAVTNPVPFEAGSNREEDEPFRERCIERLRYPDTSGNEYYYEFRAKEVPGIGKAKCQAVWAGPGTVKLTLLSSEGATPDATLIDKVRVYVEDRRPIGATVTYVGAVPLPVVITGRLMLAAGYIIEDVEQGIQTEFTAYFEEIAFDKATGYLSYAKAIEMVFRVPGVLDLQELKLNGRQMENVTIGHDEFCVLQEVSFVAD